jgi:hypothetical protein
MAAKNSALQARIRDIAVDAAHIAIRDKIAKDAAILFACPKLKRDRKLQRRVGLKFDEVFGPIEKRYRAVKKGTALAKHTQLMLFA